MKIRHKAFGTLAESDSCPPGWEEFPAKTGRAKQSAKATQATETD